MRLLVRGLAFLMGMELLAVAGYVVGRSLRWWLPFDGEPL